MKIKKLLFCFIVLICLVLSSCSAPTMDIHSLMTAPKSDVEMNGVQEFLRNKIGTDFSLKYPQEGNHRSALINTSYDDGSDGIIAFYSLDESKTPNVNSGTEVTFLKKAHNKWSEVASFHNSSVHVNRVDFGDVDNDGKSEIIIGWGNSGTNSCTITVYYQENGSITEQQLDQTYSQMAVGDFAHMNYSQIMTLSIIDQKNPITVSLFRFKDKAVQLMDSQEFDTGVVSFQNISVQQISGNQLGVTADLIKGTNNYVTEMFYWDTKTSKLKAPLYDKTSGKGIVQRKLLIKCTDINGDGITDIPFIDYLPAYSGEPSDDTGMTITWQMYDSQNGTFLPVDCVIQNTRDFYSLSLDDKWVGNITTEWNKEERSLTIYALNEDKNEKTDKLAEIRCFSKSFWMSSHSELGNNYQKAIETQDSVVTVSVNKTDNELFIDEPTLIQNIHQLNASNF